MIQLSWIQINSGIMWCGCRESKTSTGHENKSSVCHLKWLISQCWCSGHLLATSSTTGPLYFCFCFLGWTATWNRPWVIYAFVLGDCIRWFAWRITMQPSWRMKLSCSSSPAPSATAIPRKLERLVSTGPNFTKSESTQICLPINLCRWTILSKIMILFSADRNIVGVIWVCPNIAITMVIVWCGHPQYPMLPINPSENVRFTVASIIIPAVLVALRQLIRISFQKWYITMRRSDIGISITQHW